MATAATTVLAATTTNTAVPTSFVALTSVFTAPSNCASSWSFAPSAYNGFSPGLLVQNIFTARFDTACWPSDFTQYGRLENPTAQVFSPGWCPAGYTSAILRPGTTTLVTCCLSGFTYYESVVNAGSTSKGCLSTYGSGSTTVLARPDVTTPAQNADITISTFTSSALSGVTMWAQAITIGFQSNDVSLFSSTSGSATAASSGSSSSASSTSPTSSSNTSSGLSTGAKAGLGVGVALGVLFLLGIVLFLAMRSRKRRTAVATTNPHAELDGRDTAIIEMQQPTPSTKYRKIAGGRQANSAGGMHELQG